MLDKILYVVDKLICPDNYYNLFHHLPINRYNTRLLPLFRQSLIISNRITTFMDLYSHTVHVVTLAI
jgi:hypothetical protein